jgi:hypothetical protein
VATANTFQDITFNTNVLLNNWTHTTSSAIFSGNIDGAHLFTYTATTNRTGNPTSTLEVRALLNNAEISGSQSGGTLTSNNARNEVSNSFIYNIISGDAFKLQLTGDDTNAQITSVGANATVRPSIRLSINKV